MYWTRNTERQRQSKPMWLKMKWMVTDVLRLVLRQKQRVKDSWSERGGEAEIDGTFQLSGTDDSCQWSAFGENPASPAASVFLMCYFVVIVRLSDFQVIEEMDRYRRACSCRVFFLLSNECIYSDKIEMSPHTDMSFWNGALFIPF